MLYQLPLEDILWHLQSISTMCSEYYIGQDDPLCMLQSKVSGHIGKYLTLTVDEYNSLTEVLAVEMCITCCPMEYSDLALLSTVLNVREGA
jgi:hypothetical protein